MESYGDNTPYENTERWELKRFKNHMEDKEHDGAPKISEDDDLKQYSMKIPAKLKCN